MRAFGIIVPCVVLLIGGGMAWYMFNYPTYTYRYRMTVEVMVDDAVRSGASVIEVKINKQPQFGSAPPQVSRVRGEAVFVDLGDGRNVIALLAAGSRAENVDYPYNVVPTLFGLTFDDRDLAKLSGLRGSRELAANYLPTFVTFTDLNDPKTARIVGAGEFEQEFGKGVRFKRARVEVTSDQVTVGIETKIPGLQNPERWNAQLRNEPFDINRLRVGSGAFKRENW